MFENKYRMLNLFNPLQNYDMIKNDQLTCWEVFLTDGSSFGVVVLRYTPLHGVLV